MLLDRYGGPSLPDFTMRPCMDSLLWYRSIRRPKSTLQDSPKINGMCMHLYNCISVVLLVPRLNLVFLSPKLSRGIDIVLFCLCPMESITLGILLGYLLQLASVRLQIILFGLRTANNVLRPKHTGMRFMTHRAQWMQKHKFSVTCPNALFVKFVPVPPENEN
jgi:hypothetical protein